VRRAVVRRTEFRGLFQHLDERLNLTEVSLMSRFLKVFGIGAMSSVYLMQGVCTQMEHGFSVFPSIGTSFSGLTSSLGGLI
jgi:hypothetical protein